jgi:hypothetical protein
LDIALELKIANLKSEDSHTPWCNGNTAPFGGVILGSNPSGVAM